MCVVMVLVTSCNRHLNNNDDDDTTIYKAP